MKFFEKFDTSIIVCLLIIIIFATINSFSLNSFNDIFVKHLLFILIGLSLFVLFQFIPIKIIMASSYLLLFFNLLILLLFIILSNTIGVYINRASILSVSILLRFTFIIAIVRFFYNRKKFINSLNVLIGGLFLLFISLIPLFFVQELSTMIILIVSFLIIIIIFNVNLRNILIILLFMGNIVFSFFPIIWSVYIILVIILLFFINIKHNNIIKITIINIFSGTLTMLFWYFMSSIKKMQLLNYILPNRDVHGFGWDLLQSKIAIGSGGIIGKGFTRGTQKGIAFIKVQYRELIYTVIGEEWGLMGFFILLIPFLIIMLKIMYINQQIKNKYSRVIVITFINIIVFQIMANILMTIGVIPYFGFTLNLFSYNPTEIILTLIIFGIINKVCVERFEYW